MLKITITLALVSFAISFNANAFQSDSTTIRFNIEVPGETPEQSTIFWAGTQNIERAAGAVPVLTRYLY